MKSHGSHHPSSKLEDVSSQRSILETLCPGSFLGACNIGNFILVDSEVPSSRRKGCVGTEPRQKEGLCRHRTTSEERAVSAQNHFIYTHGVGSFEM